MPQGYLVQLGNGTLDASDAIVDPLTEFLIQEDLGSGEWVWSGTYNGTAYTNTVEPGQYVLATDGNVYFIPDFGPVTTISSADVEALPPTAYSDSDGVVGGSAGNETIDAGYTDDDGDQVNLDGNNDDIRSGDGDDSIVSGAGADTITAGGGGDTVVAGGGRDEIYGDSNGATSVNEVLTWDTLGDDGEDLSGGFTFSTGEMDVTVGATDDGNNNPTFEIDTAAVFVETGEPFDPNSGLRLFANGDGDSSTITIDFAAGSGSAMSDEIENVSFRISDVDWGSGNHRDIVTVDAFDANGDAVTVTITPGGTQTVSGNTITSGDVATGNTDEAGSILIEIAGPVSSIEISYSNGLNGTQAINVSNIHFDTIVPPDGNDRIDGGAGDDDIFGEGGDDTLIGGSGSDNISGGGGDDAIYVAQGDTATGGEGDDTFYLTDLGEPGNDGITITGSEGGETAGDTLILTPDVAYDDITFTNTDDAAGGFSGNFTMADGTVVQFNEIENIICFTPSTLILTDRGQRPIESLRAGDGIVTRDHGVQPLRWIGASTVPGEGRLAPLRIDASVIEGARRSLLVSPQHRILLAGWETQLLFGEDEVFASATHLLDNGSVRPEPCAAVTYLHLMLDRHEVIYAEGAATESFHAGPTGLAAISDRALHEVLTLFPELRGNSMAHGPTARRCLKQHEARLLTGSAHAPRSSHQPAQGSVLAGLLVA